MPLIYQGKITFSDLVPGLTSAAERLLDAEPSYQKMLDEASGGVAWLDKKVNDLQAEHIRVGTVLQNAEEALERAEEILNEAKGLLSKISDALNDSGIYHYSYVGQIGNLAGDIASHVATHNGLPESAGTTAEAVAGTLIIVGGDGDTLASANKIKRLFNQIGKNGQNIADLYRAEVGLPADPDPEYPWEP